MKSDAPSRCPPIDSTSERMIGGRRLQWGRANAPRSSEGRSTSILMGRSCSTSWVPAGTALKILLIRSRRSASESSESKKMEWNSSPIT